MPRDYWLWWWSGPVLLFATNYFFFTGSDVSPSILMAAGLTMMVVWLALVLVGAKRNKESPKNVAYWWSLIAIGVFVVFGSWMYIFPQRGLVTNLLAIAFVAVWLIGGLAVIVLWLVAKSRSKSVQTTRPCPYCAEQIQIAAVKCRFCSESLASQ